MTKKLRNSLGASGLVLAGMLAPWGAADAQSADQQRLEELQRLIQQQQAQIQEQARMLERMQRELQQLSTTAKQNAAAAAQAAQAAEAARQAGQQQQASQAQEPPKMVTSGRRGVKVELSGQVNRAALFFDDGVKSDVAHVDNDNSSTRFRILGVGQINDEWKVGTQLEAQFESNSTAAIDQFDFNGIGPDNFTERKLEAYIDSKTFGRLWLGQGDTASNNSAEEDLSGMAVLMYSSIGDFAGGFFLRTEGPGVGAGAAVRLRSPGGKRVPKAPAPGFTARTIADVFSNFDGRSRDDRIRYDTPTWNGFQFSASHISNEDDEWDVAGRFHGKLADTKIAAAIAYSTVNDIGRIDGSISALHSSGLNLTVAAGSDERTGRDDALFYYVKLGFLRKFLTDLGNTGVAVDYYHGDDMAVQGDDSNSVGFGIVQNIDKVATELYVGVRLYDYDEPGVNYETFWGVLAGARVKF